MGEEEIMAVAISNTYFDGFNGNDLTIANVVVGASDNCIVVFTTVQDSNHANYPIVSVTRDGQSFTKIQHYEPAGNVRVEAWGLKSPNVNTSNLSVDITNGVGDFNVLVVVMSGADTTTQPDVYNGGSGSGFAPSVSVTTTVDDDMLLHALVAEADITGVGAGQTIIQDYQDQSYENSMFSYKAAGTAGSKSMSANMASGQPYAQIVVAVKAAAAAGTTKHFLSLMGVGK